MDTNSIPVAKNVVVHETCLQDLVAVSHDAVDQFIIVKWKVKTHRIWRARDCHHYAGQCSVGAFFFCRVSDVVELHNLLEHFAKACLCVKGKARVATVVQQSGDVLVSKFDQFGIESFFGNVVHENLPEKSHIKIEKDTVGHKLEKFQTQVRATTNRTQDIMDNDSNNQQTKANAPPTKKVPYTVCKCEQVDFNNVVFCQPRTNMNNGRNVDIKYRNPQTGDLTALWIQTPKMRIPFGVGSSANFADSNRDKAPNFSIDLSLSGLRSGNNQAVADFEQFCNKWDNMIVLAAAQNTQNWFGRERSENTIRELQKTLLKEPSNMKYDPTIKIKLPRHQRNGWTTMVFDQDNQPLTVDDLNVGDEAIAIFETKYLWFVGNQFGTSLEGKQFKSFHKEELKHCIVMEDTIQPMVDVDGSVSVMG